ncbi:MAG: hypothetical protein QNJ22_23475 [Desulfosarcinaceae bacterium]|nr:hypothetical protein [Desulfosarcinaceae bacterium]
MFTSKVLYNLLPRFYHLKETGANSELKALFDVLAREIGLVENEIQQLYDNAFIETCDTWAIPYIGDLLGVETQHDLTTATFNARARVANTIAHRRRKGTLSMLAGFAADSSGWKVHAVEFMQRLATTQHVSHVRKGAIYTVDVGRIRRDAAVAFDTSPRTVDVRAIDRRQAPVPNIMNVGLFVWRIESFFLNRVAAASVGNDAGEKQYYLDPLARETHLFNHPFPKTAIPPPDPETRVPAPLRRYPLAEEVKRIQTGDGGGTYFSDPQVVTVYLDDLAVPASQMAICDLSEWSPPPDHTRVGLDPVLGRLTLHADDDATRVHTSHAYGFSDSIGACPTGRQAAAEAFVNIGGTVDWLMEVNQTRSPVIDQRVPHLKAAVEAWNRMPAGTHGVLLITDSERYDEALPAVKLPPGSRLLVTAADTAAEIDPDLAATERPWTATLTRPCILGGLTVAGAPGEAVGNSIGLNGLLVSGEVALVTDRLDTWQIDHCSFAGQASGRLSIGAGADCRAIDIRASRLGALVLGNSSTEVSIADSVLEAAGACITASQGALDLTHCTLMGTAQCRTINADGCIFLQPLTAKRTQTGCVRYSYLAPGSRSPRPHRCQPHLALRDTPASERRRTQLRLRPSFTSLDPNHYAYAQLATTCAPEIRTGAENGAEIGAFNRLMQPQREANIRTGLNNYLRWGLNAGLIPAT